MKPVLTLLIILCVHRAFAVESETNTQGMELVKIPAGTFRMGAERDPEWQTKGLDADEAPVREVTISKAFHMGKTEVTNAEFERFRPGHRKDCAAYYAFIQKHSSTPFGAGDDDPVIGVSWQDAVTFCEWLSKQEGKPYRLPTEAEWEYACRAGTTTAYSTGDTLPETLCKEQRPINPKYMRDLAAVDTCVGRTPANAWGLHDMHGNVEEWVLDWYAPYRAVNETDPVGPDRGWHKVTRGGSHNTPVYYLRSANRSGTLPDDKHWFIGFRVVQAPMPETQPWTNDRTPQYQRDVTQKAKSWSAASEPVFTGPISYQVPPVNDAVPFYAHHHVPALTWCANGDILIFWYNCRNELGREVTILGTRLIDGANSFTPADIAVKAADRNNHGYALLNTGGELLFFQGISTGGYHENLALALSRSTDNGATWSTPSMIYGDHTQRLGASPMALPVTANGDILISMDAGQKSRLLRGSDHANRWEMMTSPKNEIVGMHAAVAECQDGSLLAMSRDYGRIYSGKMPWNRSTDGGKNWESGPSDLPAISVGQMPLLLRLREGPLLLVSFTDDYMGVSQRPITGLLTKDAEGRARRIFGAYTALSYDDGKTWQKLKPLSIGGPPKPLTSVRDREWTMDAVHGTPAGYFSGAQSPDGIIHLADSRYYQRLNLAWLEQPIPAATAEEKASEAKTEQQIQEKGSLGIPARGKGARLDFDAGKKGK